MSQVKSLQIDNFSMVFFGIFLGDGCVFSAQKKGGLESPPLQVRQIGRGYIAAMRRRRMYPPSATTPMPTVTIVSGSGTASTEMLKPGSPAR